MTITGSAGIPFAPTVYVRTMIDCLNSLGVRPATVLSYSGLTWQDLSDSRHMVDLATFSRIVSCGIRYSGEPDLGLIAGSMLQPYHTPVGIAVVTSPSVGQALDFLSRYARLVFGNLAFKLVNGPRWSTLAVRPMIPLGEANVFVMQTILGAHCRLLEAILGRTAHELVVGFPYARPAGQIASCAGYVRTINFDQECLSLELPVELLRIPCIAADPDAFAEALQACRRVELEAMQGAFVQRVKRGLLERLAKNPDASQLASELGVSARTLVRRLSEAGITYSEIKDELRRAHANWLLQHTELSIEGIASQLGYANSANFARKFKDWYCMAPSKMRQSMRVASE
ncbi:AraC family transcriptional regulator ligand-binding domain-containing protein [Variovorax guangxiensis]|uniref:AraC family transcriptional regulator n=1 Tax=Variovorax guangxiensis TaxID=1775474 RepID=UPI0028568A1E|nr:AraC family transcriptional regulator ligand-binding domain-containing protein [Variovorax guangxiensis]MDR6858591.1 AraC-like DNA-binding protein [Variovorax guangxiensis]